MSDDYGDDIEEVDLLYDNQSEIDISKNLAQHS